LEPQEFCNINLNLATSLRTSFSTDCGGRSWEYAGFGLCHDGS
jgi:hypothetical protein